MLVDWGEDIEEVTTKFWNDKIKGLVKLDGHVWDSIKDFGEKQAKNALDSDVAHRIKERRLNAE